MPCICAKVFIKQQVWTLGLSQGFYHALKATSLLPDSGEM